MKGNSMVSFHGIDLWRRTAWFAPLKYRDQNGIPVDRYGRAAYGMGRVWLDQIDDDQDAHLIQVLCTRTSVGADRYGWMPKPTYKARILTR